jgi:hypothetical protein
MVGEEKTAASAAKTTAMQTGAGEISLCMTNTSAGSNGMCVRPFAGDDGYPSVSETAMGKLVGTVPGKMPGTFHCSVCHPVSATITCRARPLGARTGSASLISFSTGISHQCADLAHPGVVRVLRVEVDAEVVAFWPDQ